MYLGGLILFFGIIIITAAIALLLRLKPFWSAIVIIQTLKYGTDTIHTDKHTKRCSHMTDPATCPLYGGSDSVPHMLLRCNNHTLKRMHINRHHHAVNLCGEEISNKGKLGSAIVTMDACNSEKLSDINIESPDDIERDIPEWAFPTTLTN